MKQGERQKVKIVSNKKSTDAPKQPIEDAQLVEPSEPVSAPPEPEEALGTPGNARLQVIWPFVAGGILAGGLGFGAAVLPAYLNPSDPLAPIL